MHSRAYPKPSRVITPLAYLLRGRIRQALKALFARQEICISTLFIDTNEQRLKLRAGQKVFWKYDNDGNEVYIYNAHRIKAIRLLLVASTHLGIEV
jgi:hypothetical protein